MLGSISLFIFLSFVLLFLSSTSLNSSRISTPFLCCFSCCPHFRHVSLSVLVLFVCFLFAAFPRERCVADRFCEGVRALKEQAIKRFTEIFQGEHQQVFVLLFCMVCTGMVWYRIGAFSL